MQGWQSPWPGHGGSGRAGWDVWPGLAVLQSLAVGKELLRARGSQLYPLHEDSEQTAPLKKHRPRGVPTARAPAGSEGGCAPRALSCQGTLPPTRIFG